MIVNSYPEVEKLAKQTVLHAMNEVPDVDSLFERQSDHSIFYKVYDDLCKQNPIIGAYYAIHLKEKYEIEIPIR